MESKVLLGSIEFCFFAHWPNRAINCAKMW